MMVVRIGMGVWRDVTSGFYSLEVPHKLFTERHPPTSSLGVGGGPSSAGANGIHGQPCRARISRSIRSTAGERLHTGCA